MKQAVNVALASFGTVIVLGLNSIGGCSAPDNFEQAACNPDAFLPDPWCRDAADAGADADAGTDTGDESDAAMIMQYASFISLPNNLLPVLYQDRVLILPQMPDGQHLANNHHGLFHLQNLQKNNV